MQLFWTKTARKIQIVMQSDLPSVQPTKNAFALKDILQSPTKFAYHWSVELVRRTYGALLTIQPASIISVCANPITLKKTTNAFQVSEFHLIHFFFTVIIFNNFPELLGRFCRNDSSCKLITNSKCSSFGVCICDSNHRALNQSVCIPILNGFCSNDVECKLYGFACINNKCQCKSNFTSISSSQCIKSKNIFNYPWLEKRI